MAARITDAVLREVRTLFSAGTLGSRSDGELLARFVARRDEAAFEAIVRRHGPMVLKTCRRILHDHHEADDAFQATFLILARKAASIEPREMVARWLYGVAVRTAVKARAMAIRRRAKEKQVTEMPEPEAVPPPVRHEVQPILDQELSRLPGKYRTPIILCDLEGRTHKEAASQLGWPIGTVSCRLSRGRAMLASRLSRRGVTPSVGTLAVPWTQGSASAGVPLPLITSTTRAAARFAAGEAAGVVSAKVAALADGVLRGMLMTKFKIVTAALVVMALGTAGTRSFDPGRRAEASGPVQGVDDARPEAVEAQTRSEPARRDGPSADEEMRRLEGTWAVTDAIEEGTRATAEQRARGLGTVVIKGDRMTMFSPNESQRGTTFTIDVDPSQNPRIMGLIPLNDKDEEDRHRPIVLAIYELKGDTLTICGGTDRPEDFEVKPGSKRDLLVLRWAKR